MALFLRCEAANSWKDSDSKYLVIPPEGAVERAEQEYQKYCKKYSDKPDWIYEVCLYEIELLPCEPTDSNIEYIDLVDDDGNEYYASAEYLWYPDIILYHQDSCKFE